jgi:LPS export ABC transporter protein LptC
VSTRQALTILLLLLVAGGVILLNRPEYIPGNQATGSDGHDAFMEDITLSVMDAAGQPVYAMTADSMTHRDDRKLLVMHNPLVHISRPDGSSWTISASRGEADDNGERVWLPGEVLLHRDASSPNGAMRITSSDVLVSPHEKQAETARKAVISTDTIRVEAVGLKADFEENRLELNSQVRGTINGAG